MRKFFRALRARAGAGRHGEEAGAGSGTECASFGGGGLGDIGRRRPPRLRKILGFFSGFFPFWPPKSPNPAPGALPAGRKCFFVSVCRPRFPKTRFWARNLAFAGISKVLDRFLAREPPETAESGSGTLTGESGVLFYVRGQAERPGDPNLGPGAQNFRFSAAKKSFRASPS